MKNIKEKKKYNSLDIKEFVNMSWDPSQKNGTLLHLAVKSNDLALVQQTIKFGAELNKKDDRGATALFYCRDLSIAEELIKYGINPNILNDNGETAVASLFPLSSNVVKYLIGYTDLDLSINYGKTLLERLISPYAYFSYNDDIRFELFELTIKSTKNINKLLYGEPILFYAAKKTKFMDITLLLAQTPGIDLHYRNDKGLDFYDCCFKNVQKEIRKRMPEFMKERELHNECNKYNI